MPRTVVHKIGSSFSKLSKKAISISIAPAILLANLDNIIPSFKPKKAPIKHKNKTETAIIKTALFLSFVGTNNDSPHKKESNETESAVDIKNITSILSSPLLIILKNGNFCVEYSIFALFFASLLLTIFNIYIKI